MAGAGLPGVLRKKVVGDQCAGRQNRGKTAHDYQGDKESFV
jgi:hypothetical protein